MGIIACPSHMILQPLLHLDLWTQTLQGLEIPILPATQAEILELHEVETKTGQLDAYTLALSFANDPLMTIKVLAHVSAQCTKRQAEAPETLKSALFMLGIGPFFQHFQKLTLVPTHLQTYPNACDELMNVVERSRRAAFFAAHFAIHRQDEDAEVIQEAALLHDAGEMLLWCHAPSLMVKISHQLKDDHRLSMADIQEKILGVQANDLTQSLMLAWQLSPLLRRCTDDRHTQHPQVRNVTLAVRLARHTENGWDCSKAKATRDADVHDIAHLLNISPEVTEQKLRELND